MRDCLIFGPPPESNGSRIECQRPGLAVLLCLHCRQFVVHEEVNLRLAVEADRQETVAPFVTRPCLLRVRDTTLEQFLRRASAGRAVARLVHVLFLRGPHGNIVNDPFNLVDVMLDIGPWEELSRRSPAKNVDGH